MMHLADFYQLAGFEPLHRNKQFKSNKIRFKNEFRKWVRIPSPPPKGLYKKDATHLKP
jgi:hypothetical protein